MVWGVFNGPDGFGCSMFCFVMLKGLGCFGYFNRLGLFGCSMYCDGMDVSMD